MSMTPPLPRPLKLSACLRPSSWQTPSAKMKIAVPNLSPGAIHLWELDLDHFVFNDVLSEDERARAGKFRFNHNRKRFPPGRPALRLLLAGYLKTNPEKIQFTYGPAGKPFVANSPL